MPFLTYSIKSDFVENYKNVKNENIMKFLNYIDLLNYKKRAILIDRNDNALEKLSKKYFDNAEKILDPDQDLINESLQNFVRILSDSIQLKENKNSIKIDFEKNIDNEIDRKLFSEYNNDVFPPSLYKFSIEKFQEDFLDKIKTFIISQNTDDKKINSLFIFHKETSKYLEGWPSNKKPFRSISSKKIEERMNDTNEDKYYSINVMKIKSGIDVMNNWWKSIPDNYRPENLVFFTDTPTKSQNDNIKKNKDMSNFLFQNLDTNRFKAKLIFLDSYKLPKQWWKHKRHFVFGKKQEERLDTSLIIDSEFGIEFVDEYNYSKLNNNKFVIISDANNTHINDIKKQTLKYT